MRIDVAKDRVPLAFRNDVAVGEGRTNLRLAELTLRLAELKDVTDKLAEVYAVDRTTEGALVRAAQVAVATAANMATSPVTAVAARGQQLAAELHTALIDRLCASDCTCLPDGGCIDYYDEDRPGDCAWCTSQQDTDGTCPAVAWPRLVGSKATW